MMRYQRPSSDCFPLSNGRKPNSQSSIKPNTTITTYREDNHHHNHKHHHPHDNSGSSTRISAFESTKPSTVRVRSATPNPSTTSPDTHFPPFPTSTTPEPTTTSAKQNNHHDTNAIGAEMTLPQWGHNKRSRGSRAENRLSGDDSSPGSGRHPVKIQRRSITVMMEKQQSTATITPPYSRGANLRSSTVSRDPPAILLNRNVEERSNRPEKKRQHNTTSPQKMHHKPSSTTHHHGQNHTFTPSSASPAGGGRVVAGESLNHSSTPSSEKETTTTATPPVAAMAGTTTTTTTEKLNLDLFEWPRIYLSLSRKEKEDDFLAMKGTKLPQRPKKRAKNIDKSLQYCFPGMWLSDLTRGRYEVREKKCVKKKRRGLKGLESMDSDSD